MSYQTLQSETGRYTVKESYLELGSLALRVDLPGRLKGEVEGLHLVCVSVCVWVGGCLCVYVCAYVCV